MWLVPTLVYLGAPSAISLAFFLIPLLTSVVRFNRTLEVFPLWSLIICFGTIAISTIHSNVSLANVLIFSGLVLQLPFGFIMLTKIDKNEYLSLVKTLNAVCLLQIVLALIQIFFWRRPGDSVNGSMLGDYHGTHIMPFVIFITVLLNWILGTISVKFLTAALFLTSFIAYRADAKLVLLGVFLFIIITALTVLFSTKTSSSTKGIAVFIFVVGNFLVIGSNFPSYAQDRWGYEIGNAFESKNIILNEYFDTTSEFGLNTSILVGAGPTQTVSRSAIIAQATSGKTLANSPLTVSQPRFYASYTQTTGKFNIGPISSISQPISSLVGILGDIGILGSVSLGILILWPIKSLLKKSSRNSSTIYLLIALFLMPLSFFNTFLEFPQAVFPLVIVLVGLSLRSTKKI